MRSMRAVLALLGALCLATSPQVTRAHQASPGEGVARVTVEGGHFVVYFGNNRTLECFKKVLDSEGNMLEERLPQDCAMPFPGPELPQGVAGPAVEAAGEVLAFGDVRPDVFGNPQMRLVHEERVTSYPLWGSGEIGYVQRASASRRWNVLLATEALSPLDRLLGEHWPLSSLHAYTPDGFGHRSVPLGRIASVWSFAVASDLVAVGETRIIAWFSEYEDGLSWRAALWLSLWNPDTGQCETVEVGRDLVWNTTVSIAVLDGRVLIAHAQPVFLVGGRALVEFATALRTEPNPMLPRRGSMVVTTKLVPLPAWARAQ